MEFKVKDKRTLIIIIAFTILFYWGLSHLDAIFSLVGRVLGIISPFLLGSAIAFVLNVPMKHIEKGLARFVKNKRALRVIGVFLAYVLGLGVIAFVISSVIPEMIRTIRQLSTGESKFFNDVSKWVMGLSETHPEITDYISSLQFNWSELMQKALEILQNSVKNVLSSTWGVATSVAGGIATTGIGLIFSAYILLLKEKLGIQVKRVMYAYLPVKWVRKTLHVLRIANQTFSGFISGQCTEAVLFGALCYLAMTIFRFPYALSISVLIGFTTLIPIVGAFLGTALGALLIMVNNPLQAVWFVIMIIVLQQIDNNLIYPKIMGNSVGLPGMWVMVAVTLGGSLMGIVGMLIFVPIVSVVYTLFRESVYVRLKKKSIKEVL